MFYLCSCCCFTWSLLSTTLLCVYACVYESVCVLLCMCLFGCINVPYNLVRFVTARGSLLCERMPVLHFLPFVFETLKPVFESLSTSIDSQFNSTCSREAETEEASGNDQKWMVCYERRQKLEEIMERPLVVNINAFIVPYFTYLKHDNWAQL